MAKQKMIRILSIDGGGIRGIIPGQVLVALEEKLQKKTNNPDARISDYFDFIAGTNMGGVLSLAYLFPNMDSPINKPRPKYSAAEIANILVSKGHTIFDVPLIHRIKSGGGTFEEKYPSLALEHILQKYFEEVKLNQLLKPCLITSYDIKRRMVHFFNQKDAIKSEGWNFLLKDVGLAATATPIYFESAEIKSMSGISYPLISGDIFVNNPALCAYAECRKEFKVTPREIALLSIGGGYTKIGIDYHQAKDWGKFGWARPLIDISMSGEAEVVDFQLRQIYDSVECPNQYLRINPELPVGVNFEMDDASEENVNALVELGTEAAQEFNNQLDDFVKLLV